MKEDVKMKYLSTQYFNEETMQDLKQHKHDTLYPPKQFTEEEIRKRAKEQLYHYRIKPKPYVDPIVQLRHQIQDEDEKGMFSKLKNEPFLKVKPIDLDMTEIQ